jgi:hypothetical protein
MTIQMCVPGMARKLILAVCVAHFLTGCASLHVIEKKYNDDHVVHMVKVMSGEIAVDEKEISKYAFYLDPGDRIPIDITVATEFAEIEYEKIGLVIKKRIYMSIHPLGPYLSLDAKRWAHPMDKDGFKEVFGFDRGVFEAFLDPRNGATGILAGMVDLGYEPYYSKQKNRPRLLGLWAQACEAGNAAACFHLGEAHHKGVEAAKDLSKAAELYQKACDSGWKQGCDSGKALSGEASPQ